MTDEAEIARHIRMCAEAFNAAVDRAHEAGISVRITTRTFLGLVQKQHVSDVRIERGGLWELDDWEEARKL